MEQNDIVGVIVGVVLMIGGIAIPLTLWQLGFILPPIPAQRLSPAEAAVLINEREIGAVAIINEERMVLYSIEGDRYVLDVADGTEDFFTPMFEAGASEDLFSRVAVRIVNRPPLLDFATIFIYLSGSLACVIGFSTAVIRGRQIRIA